VPMLADKVITLKNELEIEKEKERYKFDDIL
jgi:hypothetical protein